MTGVDDLSSSLHMQLIYSIILVEVLNQLYICVPMEDHLDQFC